MKEFKYLVEFTQEEVGIILTGIQELPAKISMGLILKIQGEVQEQFRDFSDVKDCEVKE